MRSKAFFGWTVVICGFFIMALFLGIFYTFGIFFKPMAEEYHWSATAVSGAYSLGLFVQGILFIVTGKLTDRFGPRLVVTAGGVAFGVGFILMSRVSTIWQLYLVYSLIGVGLSGAYTPITAVVTHWYSKGRGVMMGIVVSGIGFGQAIMAPLARTLINHYDWRTSYAMIGGVSLVLISILSQFLYKDPGQMGFADSPGALNAAKPKPSYSLKEALSTKQFWLLALAWMMQTYTIQSMLAHIVQHAMWTGVSATTAVTTLSLIGSISIAGRVAMGAVSDRIGGRWSIVVTFLIMVVSLVLLIGVTRTTSTFYLFAILFGFGYGATVALFPVFAAEIFGLGAVGVIIGTAHLGGTVGGTLGPSVTGYIFDSSGSYYPAFWITLVVMLIAMVAILPIKKIIPHRRVEALAK